ncbi:MAG: iron chelate uptake ABC transporter family permease subunit [Waddliaceae bacterium]
MIEFFTDPVLRAPTIGSMLICFSTALIGSIAYLRKQSLIGEALSHATYPGVIIGVIVAAWLGVSPYDQGSLTLSILLGASFTAILGYFSIIKLQSLWNISPDVALCTILSIFFGVGITLASGVQFSSPELYRQSFIYLFGQAATMTDVDLMIYGALAFIILGPLIIFYKEIHLITFDRQSAKVLKLPVAKIDAVIFLLIILSVVVGIRAVGIVLISAMLVSPAVSARYLTKRFSTMLWLAGSFGVISGFLGNYLSVTLVEKGTSLPTGPTIVLVSATICTLSLLLSPSQGLIPRLIRHFRFRLRCISENILKGIWRRDPSGTYPFSQIRGTHRMHWIFLKLILKKLVYQGQLTYQNSGYALTEEGEKRAAQIVRLHRLWEVYLANYLGASSRRVHHSAEEMEHIITPELEDELIKLLQNPTQDPHQQPIPPRSDS